uniref:Glutathione S-transferase isozyme 3 n=2 Tax=Plutella xylostella TaxID=51655 RepID=O77409_PLUXY|nr:glutathione S-transferase isozyme 3 [Plutella xylostella]
MKLYKLDMSPPARATMMVAEALGVKVDTVDVNLMKGDHTTPEYLKKNPIHTVPLLEDGDLILHDSHAIVTYLVDKYGKSDALYPKDVKKRAQVDQKLYLDATILFPRLRAVTFLIFTEGLKKPSDKMLKDIEEAYSILNSFLSTSKYLAGDQLSLADISAVATVTSLVYVLPLDEAKYPKVTAWLKTMKDLPFVKSKNEPGVTQSGQWITSSLTSK